MSRPVSDEQQQAADGWVETDAASVRDDVVRLGHAAAATYNVEIAREQVERGDDRWRHITARALRAEFARRGWIRSRNPSQPKTKPKMKSANPAKPAKKTEKVLPMSGYAYEYDGPPDKWQRGSDERWGIIMYEPTNRETLLGKRIVDGATCFVFRAGSKIIAQTAVSVRRV